MNFYNNWPLFNSFLENAYKMKLIINQIIFFKAFLESK